MPVEFNAHLIVRARKVEAILTTRIDAPGESDELVWASCDPVVAEPSSFPYDTWVRHLADTIAQLADELGIAVWDWQHGRDLDEVVK